MNRSKVITGYCRAVLFHICLIFSILLFTPTLKALEPAVSLKLATRENRPPYVQNNAESGIEIDIIQAVFNRMDITPVFVQMPRIRSVHMFEQAHVDGLLAQNPASTHTGCATNWYIYHQNIGLSLKKRQLTLFHLKDLKNHSVVSFRGATLQLGGRYAQIVQDANKYFETENQDTHIRLLHEARFDVAVGDIRTLSLAQQRYQDRTGNSEEFTTHKILPPTRYVVRFHEKQYCARFNEALQAIRASGAYDKIWASYETPSFAER